MNVQFVPQHLQLAAIVIIETPQDQQLNSAAYLRAIADFSNWRDANKREASKRRAILDRVYAIRDAQ